MFTNKQKRSLQQAGADFAGDCEEGDEVGFSEFYDLADSWCWSAFNRKGTPMERAAAAEWIAEGFYDAQQT